MLSVLNVDPPPRAVLPAQNEILLSYHSNLNPAVSVLWCSIFIYVTVISILQSVCSYFHFVFFVLPLFNSFHFHFCYGFTSCHAIAFRFLRYHDLVFPLFLSVYLFCVDCWVFSVLLDPYTYSYIESSGLYFHSHYGS